ncbi:hypothetical protein DRO91_07350 [Candidatus Heimdallarchaeota archaeon]|nr:MAG: hypothetical protein DRO91_07350 [Candidatus Heimdallarchaeota archaeon]
MMMATPQMIRAKIKKYKPDIVVVDSLTATDAPKGGKGRDIRHDVVFTTREFKKVAELEQIPILIVHHTTKGKDKFGEISKDVASESDEVAKVADIIYHIQSSKEMEDKNLLYFGIAKCRDGDKENFTLCCDMSVPMFGIESIGLVKEPVDRPDWL